MAKKTYTDFDDTMLLPGLALYTSYKICPNKKKFINKQLANIKLNPKRLETCKGKSLTVVSLNDSQLIQQVIINNKETIDKYKITIENIHGNFKNKDKKQYFLEKNMTDKDVYIGDIFEKDLTINGSFTQILDTYSSNQLYKLYLKKIYNLCSNLINNIF